MQFGPKDTRTVDELAKLGYEREDVGLRTIAFWVFWFFVFTILMGGVTALIYQFVVPSGLGPTVESQKRTRFPETPRIQDGIRAKTDIYDLRHHEEQILSGAEGKGIPIDKAIEEAAKAYEDGATLRELGAKPMGVNPERAGGGH